MTDYRQAYVPGASWFFTVNLAKHKGNRLLTDKIGLLRNTFDYTKQRHSFRMDAVVVAGSFALHLDTAAGRRLFFNELEGIERLYFKED
jgi:hypothetical protein